MDSLRLHLKDKRSIVTLFFYLALFCTDPFFTNAADYDQEIEILSLFYPEDEIVVSASKREQNIMESPSAIYVITKEDIKYSGAKKVTDIFRMVPGVDVADINAFYTGVQSRGFGFIPQFARQMLVLVDGRTVYSPQINATFWDQIPLFIENIERVEVIRGPNAALYGANAFNGVINIITKDPEKTKGGFISVTAGQRESRWSTLRYGGTSGELTYRATVGYYETKGFSGVHDQIRKPQVTLRADYQIDENSSLDFYGGYAGGDRELASQVDPEVTSYFLMAKYKQRLPRGFSLFAQYYNTYTNSAMTPYNLDDITREHDIAIQINKDGSRYHLIWGIGYRFDEVKHGFLSGNNFLDYIKDGPHGFDDSAHHNTVFNSFADCTVKITDKLNFTVALMVENNKFVGTHYSPKASLVYMPWGNHSFRFSISRAFRVPSFIEEKSDFSVPVPFPPFCQAQRGNSRLNPEKITSYEIGYRGKFFNSRLSLNIEGFYQDISDIITYRQKRPGIWRYGNFESDHVKGMETSMIWNLKKWWRLSMSYTLQEAANDFLKGLVINQKFNIGCRFILPEGFVANMQVYFVDRLHFERDAFVPQNTIDDYTRLDLRISKTFYKNKIEIALIGQNLLESRHYEYSKFLTTGEANRTLFLELNYHFGK